MDNYSTPLELIKEDYNSSIKKRIQKFKNILSTNCHDF